MSRPCCQIGLASLLGLLCVAWSTEVVCEVRRLEVVGATAIQNESRQRITPKDRAIQEGLLDAVSRVAADVLLEDLVLGQFGESEAFPEELPDLLHGTPLAWQSPFEVLEPTRELERRQVEKALGKDMLPYTKKFRILEDQEERPSLFTYHPDAATEYVLIMEVQVEVERVRQRLEEAGLIDPLQGRTLEGIEVELLGIRHYPLYAAVVDLLAMPPINAAVVTPESFEADRVQLRVQGEWSASELGQRMQSAAPANLRIEAVSVDDGLVKEGLWSWGPSPRPKLSVAIHRVEASPGLSEGADFATGPEDPKIPTQAAGVEHEILVDPVGRTPD